MSVHSELQNVTAKLVVKNVSKTFESAQGKVDALKDVSLTINEGEFVCLVGPSGPGRDRMVMFQEHALFPWLDVMGNVLFGLKLKPNLTDPERREVAKFYLHLVGLDQFERASIHELSGGMRQRVALARSLAPNPRILLMDETFGALDALTREQLYGEIQQIWEKRKKTILFVTHNIREAVCLGDRVILFSPHPGRIVKTFEINLPRPRDINDPALTSYASEITAYLKNQFGRAVAE